MRYQNRTVEAAFALAVTGEVETQVGDIDGFGADWQALVTVTRTALLLHDVYRIHYPHVPPGTKTLMWLVRHDDVVTCREQVDYDEEPENIAGLYESFARVTEYYNKPPEGLDEMNFEWTDPKFDFTFDFGEGVKS